MPRQTMYAPSHHTQSAGAQLNERLSVTADTMLVLAEEIVTVNR